MNLKRLLGSTAIIAGAALLVFSAYLKGRLSDAEGQISDAKRKVNTGEKLFSLNPVAKEIGQELTGSAKEKISDAEQRVAQYYTIETWCHRGGIGFIVIGAGLVLFSRKRRK